MSFAFSAFSSRLQDSCGSVATLLVTTFVSQQHGLGRGTLPYSLPILPPSVLPREREINFTQLETRRFVLWIVFQLTLRTRPLVWSSCLYLCIMPWVIKTVLEISHPKKFRGVENEQIHIRPSEYWGTAKNPRLEPALWHLQNPAMFYSIDFSLLQPRQLLVHKIGMWPFLLPAWFTHSRVLLLGKQFRDMQICLNSLLVFLSLRADFREHLLSTGIFYMEMKRGNRKECRVDMWFTNLKSHFLGKGSPGMFHQTYLLLHNQRGWSRHPTPALSVGWVGASP